MDAGITHYPTAIELLPISPLSWHIQPVQEESLFLSIRQAEISPTVRLWHAHYDPLRFSDRHSQVQAALCTAGLEASPKKRQAEFWAGRKLIMLALDLQDPPGRMKSGAPNFPKDRSGSLSHSSNNILLLIGPEGLSMGVDIERALAPISLQAVINRVATRIEKRWLHTLNDQQQRIAATILFSAKEALFKALCTNMNIRPGYAAAEVKEPPQHGTLSVELTRNLGPGLSCHNRFTLGYDQVNDLTLTWLYSSSM
ncbi:4'-phosphopantetheinyl transferase [Serratia proteamaculans]|uniref:4'-phosphopantetheinyl transferase family protein n=1 Tax=Serratia proteamaculans TaxID=28151 RepID=UPI0009F7D3F4|nr:4'-phosphopantetheinyl transferase superfamily protein [Serratia proteamaculans]SMB45815.1 4'-phosphopantetheinyl transferase [Serratia proteamaculans]